MKRPFSIINFSNKKLPAAQMNLSNQSLPSKNPRTAKYATFSHQRRISIQNEANRRIFEKLDSFAKEAAIPIPLPAPVQRPKKAGKIMRNVALEEEKRKEVDENVRRRERGSEGVEIISKIRCSQLAKEPQRSTFMPLKENNKFATTQPLQRNTRSSSSHYEIQYANLVSEYERKKELINHQIECLRKTQPLTLQKLSSKSPYEETFHTETPKFGTNIPNPIALPKPTTKAKSVSKSKDPKNNPFLTAIRTQMDLQQKLRKLKHQISIQQQGKIGKILEEQYKVDQSITILDSEQFDPFSQLQHPPLQSLASDLASAYRSAQQHWSTIKNSLQPSLLLEIFSSLQTEKQKDCISLKGFVRQLGVLFQNERYLRNRDLYRIYKRIFPFTRDNFLAVLGKQ